MKFTHFENQFGFEINMIPETPAEVAELSRIAMNKSAEPAGINLYMEKEPSASIWIKKVKPVAQKNTITRKH